MPYRDLVPFLRQLHALVPCLLAVGAHTHERVEHQVHDRLDVVYLHRQQRRVPGHHPRTLLGDIVCNHEFGCISLVEVDHPIERVVVDDYCLLFAEGNRPASVHMICFPEGLKKGVHSQEVLAASILTPVIKESLFVVLDVLVEEEFMELCLVVEMQITESVGHCKI